MRKFRLTAAAILSCLLMATPCEAAVATPSEVEREDFEVPELTGDYLTDIMNIAWSQIGYEEDDRGHTKYSDWAGQPGRAWCSEFVAWCADQANIPKSIIPKGLSSNQYRNFYSSRNRYYLLENDRDHTKCGCGAASSGVLTLDELQEGDILLIETNGNFSDGPDHTELLVSVSDGTLYTVGGNIGGAVQENRKKAYAIHGVCRPDYEGTDKSSSSGSGSSGGSHSGGSGGSGGGGGSSRVVYGTTGGTGAGPAYTGITTIGTYAYGTRWEKAGDKWRLYAAGERYAANQWAYSNKHWYLFDSNTYMLTGWQLVDGKWYYLNGDGSMATGWVFLDNKWYCLAQNGEMYASTYTPDGYYVDATGAWVQ